MTFPPAPSPAYWPAATASPALVMTPASIDSPSKESYFLQGPYTPPPPFDAEPPAASGPKRSRRLLPRLDWHAAQSVWWAAFPLLLYGIALALAISVLFNTSPRHAFFTVAQQGGTGRLDYFVLSERSPLIFLRPRDKPLTTSPRLTDSCAVVPGSTERYCESPAIYANFLPSLTRISSFLPGLASVKLPFFSHQTTAIFVASTVLLAASFLAYLPLWILVYFPRTRLLPPPFVRFVRYHSRRAFDLAGALVFISFILHVTIGLGYQLYLIGFRDDFTRWLQFGAYSLGSAQVEWTARIGRGFDIVWVGCTCEALLVIAIKVSLHNGLDERVEWPEGDSKEQY